MKFVPLDVSIRGKDVSEEQPDHASSKTVPLDVSIRGKDVISLQSRQN